MTARTKEIELTVRVRVPKHWSAAHTRREVADHWHGEFFAVGPPPLDPFSLPDEVVLRPRWLRAAKVVR